MSCLCCPGLMSELSDQSFCDPSLPEIMKDERISTSTAISGTHRGEDSLRVVLGKREIEAEVIDSSIAVASQETHSYFKKGNVSARQRFGGWIHIPPSNGIEEQDNMSGRLVALVTILNSSMGGSWLFRGILQRIPFRLFRSYSAMLNRALAWDRNR